MRWWSKSLLGVAILVGSCWWLLPPVWQLQTDSGILVQRWRPKQGPVAELVGSGRPGWTPVEAVSLHAVHAVVVSEDARFYEHAGFDLSEIWASFLANLQAGRYVRGGSTITQQVVKMAFLDRDKTLLRKLREVFGAVCLEILLNKHEILSWYLNMIELGHGVYGIYEGAGHYFYTTPELLTAVEGIHLALVLPSPNSWSKGLRQRQLTPFGHRRFARIAEKLQAVDWLTQAQWEHVMAQGDFGSPIRRQKKGKNRE